MSASPRVQATAVRDAPTPADDARSGKDHGDENFPVASFLIKPAHRAAILAFYRFARTADDVADHAAMPADEKLRHLEALRAALAGEQASEPSARAYRTALAARGLAPTHGLELLEAFRRDVTKRRYADWGELIDYCRYSAMPVGRQVLDVHGEDRAAWPASDALCAALQVINHLQDCRKDYLALDRVYVPQDALAAEGETVDALAAPRASPALRRVIGGLARRTLALLDASRPFAGQIRDRRLALEVAFIQRAAESLVEKLIAHDPLSERVHHTRLELARVGAGALGAFLRRRAGASA